MPKVPNVDPSQLEAITGGQYQPQPENMLMAAMDMHSKGELIEPAYQSAHKTGANMRMLPKSWGKPVKAHKRR